MDTYVCVYLCIEKERERERERNVCGYIDTNSYVYEVLRGRWRGREREL